MAYTEGRFARPEERRWDCRRGTPSRNKPLIKFVQLDINI